MAATSASKAVCRVPRDSEPWAMASPFPSASAVTIQPIPEDFLEEPSVQAWIVALRALGLVHGVWSLGLGLVLSTACPSLSKDPCPEAPLYQGERRLREESSVAGGGMCSAHTPAG